ncbi:MAG: hypothetical protein M3Q51_03050, partial [Pseudomonadota bacterium]|nr:hypothetical protein [Pseudomonadota bacterium]
MAAAQLSAYRIKQKRSSRRGRASRLRLQAIWLDDLPVGVMVGATTSQKLHYIEPDHLGTPRVVIDPVRD